MMKGYDKQEALTFILGRIHAKDHPALAQRLETLISQAIDIDIEYMHRHGVLDEDGFAGEGYYEDDEALEYIVETLTQRNQLSADEAVQVAALMIDYLELQQAYLENKGLAEWE